MRQFDVRQSMNLFTVNFLDAMQKHLSENENLFYAPGSIYAVIAMLLSGADGTTAEELKTILCLPNDLENFHELFSILWAGLLKANNGTNMCKLDMANRLWIKAGAQVEERYRNQLKERYQSDTVNIDFTNNDSVVEEVNNWVATCTKQKITDVIKPGKVSKHTAFLITNAMYFYGQWSSAFETADTSTMPFHTADGTTVDVDMMYQKATLGFYEDKQFDAKFLLLPYKQSSLRFMVVLPNKVDKLPELEKHFMWSMKDDNSFYDFTLINNREVHVYLPKFKISQTNDLVEPIKSLGAHHIFSNADLSSMSKTEDLFVSGISHAANIEIDEVGTVVAAYTDCNIQRAGMIRHLEFKADHPFLFMVADYDTEVVLFWGRMCNPGNK